MSESKPTPTHCLSVDVEDYFHVAAFRKSIAVSDWENLPSRVEKNTGLLLDLLEELGVKATFFVVGRVAEKYPHIVRRIVQAGHEFGCHSYSHQLIYELDPQAFRQDTRKALDVIQQTTGQPVTRYRAPSFSITERSTWALEILTEAGITHDSSIFPIQHDLYGMPGAPRAPFVLKVAGAELIEFPPSTIKLFGVNLPVTGGGYTRILPLCYQKYALRMLERNRVPGMVYLHPWEIDAEQPRIKAPLRSRVRHYTGLSKTARRIRELSAEFRFGTMSAALPEELPVFELEKNGDFRTCPRGFASPGPVLKSRGSPEGVRMWR